MAINMNSGDSSACSSPRISFSRDFPETNSIENNREIDDSIRLDKLDSNCDFNFCVTSNRDNETSSADELFFNGVIIPIQLREKKTDSINGCLKREEEEEITSTTRATLIREEKTSSKSFWRFKRSSSMNCENFGDKTRRSSIWSLPLLLRSKSTGSSSSVIDSKHNQKANSNNSKLIMSINSNSMSRCSSSSSTLSSSNSLPSSNQKPPLMRKNGHGGGFYVNGVRNNPVLNIPPPYIAKGTSDLLGLGSLFRNGSKDKKIKK